MAQPRDEEMPKRKLNREGLQKLLGIYRFMLPYRLPFAAGMAFLVLSTFSFASIDIIIFPQEIYLLRGGATAPVSSNVSSPTNYPFITPTDTN